VFFGNVVAYKGVDLLLDAARALPAELVLDVLVVGRCRDEVLRKDLEARAARAGGRVRTRFAYLLDSELAAHLAAADLAVFPFRSVTNSSSVARALGVGLPVIVPRLAALDDLPDDATLRYEPGVAGLIEALTRAAALDPPARARLRTGADRYAEGRTWGAAAAATHRLYTEVLDGSVAADVGRPRSATESTAPLVLR
jgi:glycosyltransferase involved in cell wall biosynthesis